jgi:hypothetical protein
MANFVLIGANDLPTLDDLEHRYLLRVLIIVGDQRARVAEVMGGN